MLHNQDKQSSVSHNNGWGKSRKLVLNRKESSVSHNQDKQSSVSHIKLCVTQSGQVKLCVTKGPGKKPEPGFEQAEKLCVTQSGQAKLCVTNEALCYTTTAREKAGTRF